ncbi:hypothetical protein Tco_0940584 [Tanacetum coccineum]|uniref:Uncharacterized protein n=1 Tax=Tanacetum coccineum TaxID=301880 RepID=A0ABQ5DV54_9ASTR
MGMGLLHENAQPLGSFVVGSKSSCLVSLGVRFLRTHENNLKLEGPGTSGSGSQNRARALEVTVAGIIFSLALTESISSKDLFFFSAEGMTSALIVAISLPDRVKVGNATSLPAWSLLEQLNHWLSLGRNSCRVNEADDFMLAYEVTSWIWIFEITVLERNGSYCKDRLFNLMLGGENLSRDILDGSTEISFIILKPKRGNIRSTEEQREVLVRASRPILLPDIIGRSSSETRARKALFRFVPVLHFLLIEKREFLIFRSFCGVLRYFFFVLFFSLPRDRSAKRERARRRKGQPNGNEQERKMTSEVPWALHILERRVEVFGPVIFTRPPSSGGACVGVRQTEIGLESYHLYQRATVMDVGHDYYKIAPMKR